MGFESSRAARRRLAAIAATNERVQEALAPTSFPGLFAGSSSSPYGDVSVSRRPMNAVSSGATHAGAMQAGAMHAVAPSAPSALARQLESLAQDIAATPGAGGALLAAYAALARALLLVIEAARRGGTSPLPQAVLTAAQEALETPAQLVGLV